MSILEIHDCQQPSGLVVVDPRHVLALLGERACQMSWRVGGVARFDEEPMIVGEAAAECLEALSHSQDLVSGALLCELIQQTVQIIWGEFRAYEDGDQMPWLTIRAIDSTWCEIETDDDEVLDLVRRSFADVRTLA